MILDCNSYGAVTFAVGFLLGGAVMFAILYSAHWMLLRIPKTTITAQDIKIMLQRNAEIKALTITARQGLSNFRCQ